jgi:hypothetical protein
MLNIKQWAAALAFLLLIAAGFVFVSLGQTSGAKEENPAVGQKLDAPIPSTSQQATDAKCIRPTARSPARGC